MTTPDCFVLFADVLGFKRLVLRHKVPFPEHLDFRDRAIGRTLGGLINYGNPLGEAFTAFHGGIDIIANQMPWSTQVSLIVFSDSLFLATESALDCMSFGERLLRYTIGQATPMRMGIGYGSFVPYGLAFEESPRIKLFSSQFFGTGVVHAVGAEKQLSGIRIAIHRTASDVINNDDTLRPRLIALPEADACEDVEYELNYLVSINGSPHTHHIDPVEFNSIVSTLDTHFARMHIAAGDGARVSEIYDGTLTATRRMREAIQFHYS